MGFIEGYRYLPGYLDHVRQTCLLTMLREVVRAAPLYTPSMPRSGKPLSVKMTNCGPLGWMTDKNEGYRYQALHPASGLPWPEIPDLLGKIWIDLANYHALPEACLVNYYAAGSKLGSHRDADEDDKAAPVISLSLGDDAVFHIGGLKRGDPKRRLTLRSGDVVVLGGLSRHAYHGVDRIIAGTSSLLAEGGRINVTMRRVTRP